MGLVPVFKKLRFLNVITEMKWQNSSFFFYTFQQFSKQRAKSYRNVLYHCLFVKAVRLDSQHLSPSDQHARGTFRSRRNAADTSPHGKDVPSNHRSLVDHGRKGMMFPFAEKNQVEGSGSGTGSRDIEYVQMERWLDAHPAFLQDYFRRKVRRTNVTSRVPGDESSQIDCVLSINGPVTILPASLDLVEDLIICGGKGCDVPTPLSPTGESSAVPHSSTGMVTPVRKISSQEFERNGHVLKPMVQTVDGIPSFLGVTSSSASTGGVRGREGEPVKIRRRRSELKKLDEHQLMYELIMDICNDLDVTGLCHKILQNVCLLLNADRCSLFLVQGQRGQADCSLVSKLFDVGAGTSLEDSTRLSREIRVPWGTGIIGHVAVTGESLNITDAYKVQFLIVYAETVILLVFRCKDIHFICHLLA